MAPTLKLQTSYGGYYVSTPAATTIATGDTPVKAAGTTTAFASISGDMEMSADNQLKFTGAQKKVFKVDVAAELDVASGTTQDLELSIFKTPAGGAAALVTGSKLATEAAATEATQVFASCLVELDTNDLIEVYVANVDGTPNITATRLILTAIGFPV